MSTIKDVARLANVSVATVSRVMNNSPKASAASREVVQKAMAELGYTPNANASYEFGFAHKTRSPNLYERQDGPLY